MKKTNKITPAKVDSFYASNIGDFVVNINGFFYKSKGTRFSESLFDAVEDHVSRDRAFNDYIKVIGNGDGVDGELNIYSPAVLCAFGYMEKDDLAQFLLTTFFEEDTNEGISDAKDGTDS